MVWPPRPEKDLRLQGARTSHPGILRSERPKTPDSTVRSARPALTASSCHRPLTSSVGIKWAKVKAREAVNQWGGNSFVATGGPPVEGSSTGGPPVEGSSTGGPPVATIGGLRPFVLSLSALRVGEGSQDVRTGHEADWPALLVHHDDPVNVSVEHRPRQFGQGRLRSDRDHVGGHVAPDGADR